MRKLALVLAALAVTAAGCGGSKHAALDPAHADAVISKQVRAGLATKLHERTGDTYATTADCISVGGSGLTRFKCTTTATNTADESDYAEAVVDVTCESPGSNCVWQVEQ